MEIYLNVRLACSEAITQRHAAKHFNISRDSVAKMLAYSTPLGYRRRSPIQRPKLDAFVSSIDQWPEEDMKVPRKHPVGRATRARKPKRVGDGRSATALEQEYAPGHDRLQRQPPVFIPPHPSS